MKHRSVKIYEINFIQKGCSLVGEKNIFKAINQEKGLESSLYLYMDFNNKKTTKN